MIKLINNLINFLENINNPYINKYVREIKKGVLNESRNEKQGKTN